MLSSSPYFLSVVRRMTSARNVAVVLAAHGAPMVSIDISVAVPGKAPSQQQQQGAAAAASSSNSSIARIVEKNMLRVRDDSALKTLERLRLLLGPPDLLKSRAAKKSRDELLAQCPSAELLDADGNVIENLEAMSNEVAWRTAKAIRLGANTTSPLVIPIKYNLPTVTAVQPPNIVFVGVPCVCTSVTTMFAGDNDLLYEWRLAPLSAASVGHPNQQKQQHQQHAAPPASAAAVDMDSPALSTESVLLPPPSALGRRLRFRVRINAPDSMWTEVESPPVLPTPRGFEPMPRWAHLKPRADKQHIRVCTYNILHDGFATSKRSRAKMYPFAPNDVLDINYRRARVAQELIKYDSDIVALQECGRSVYDGYLEPILKSRGFAGRLRVKNNTSREGVALLLRKERFHIERWVDMTLNLRELKRLIESLKKMPAAGDPAAASAADGDTVDPKQKEDAKLTLEQLEQITANPQFTEAMEQVPSVGLVCVAFDKIVGRRVVVGNTHLYYHALGCHIRLVQAFMLAHRMQGMAEMAAPWKAPSLASTDAAPAAASAAGAPEGKSEEKKHDGENSGDDDNAAAAAASSSSSSSPTIPVEQILVGDFNFTRPTGGYTLMTKGSVDKQHVSWDKSSKYFWNIDAVQAAVGSGGSVPGGAAGADAEGLTLEEEKEEDEGPMIPSAAGEGEAAEEEEEEKGAAASAAAAADGGKQHEGPIRAPSSTRVALDLKLPQPCAFTDVYANEPSLTCTNYSLWFKEIIDHIFVSKGVKTVRVLPAPSRDELAEDIAIPSHIFPSDHVALVADLKFDDNDRK